MSSVRLLVIRSLSRNKRMGLLTIGALGLKGASIHAPAQLSAQLTFLLDQIEAIRASRSPALARL